MRGDPLCPACACLLPVAGGAKPGFAGGAPAKPDNEVPQIYLDHLNAITGDANPETLRDVWEVDGVLEFPYGQSLGIAPRVEGIDAIIEYFSGLGYFKDFTFSNMRSWPIAGAPEYVLEMHGSATLVDSGKAYEQDYIVRFGVGPDQKLAWMREYWDPTRV